jgi:D-alanyl-D-alanine carboxypeptidase/D-alanyl-D-alanine-endopeptidase (penicillin-binding protein 4)
MSATSLIPKMTINCAKTKWVSILLLIALSFATGIPVSAQQGAERERRTTVTPVASAKALTDLQARLTAILRKPELASAMIGIKVASLDTGRVLFEENANKLLRPASNMKLYIVAAALDRLSPDYHFNTSVYASSRPDAAGIVNGDLTIYGRGDPSIAARFNNGDYFKGINDLAALIAAAGVKRVEGDLIGDESYFVGAPYGSGWEWEDLQWWFGAEVTALSVNDNALDLFVKPGANVGAPAVVTTGPPDPLLTIVNRATTGARVTKRDVSIYRGLNENTITISGNVPLDDPGYSAAVGISHPALLFVYLLRAALTQKGVMITGKTRVLPASTQPFLAAGANPTSLSRVEIASLQSPPLSVIGAQTLKRSQNLYTELILRTLGKNAPPNSTASGAILSSESAGLEVIKSFLKAAGVNPDGLALSDGSGLSRDDMVTPEATVQLLTYMTHHTHAKVFRESLAIAGVDGTLRNRFKGTPAENNVRAKTGSLNSAASLSGYLTTAAGENLVFSIIVNNYPDSAEPRTICIDPIILLLASFAGRS